MKAASFALAVITLVSSTAFPQQEPSVELALYEGLSSQFVISLPKGWSAYDQTRGFTGSESATGVVIFSAVNLAQMGLGPGAAPESDFQTMIRKIDSGEIPGFFVDRGPAGRGMACTGFSKGAAKEVRASLLTDPMWQRGREVVTDLAAIEEAVGGCQGLHFHGTTLSRDGTERVMDTRAASDGAFLYLFSLRNDRPFFEHNLPLYEASLSSLRLRATTSTSANTKEANGETPFEWDSKFASPNTSLILQEIDRPPRAPNHQVVLYELRATGFSSGESLSLWVRRGMRHFVFYATVNPQGLVEFKLRQQTFRSLGVLAYVRDQGFAVLTPRAAGTKGLVLSGFAEGHPLDVALVSEGTGKRAQAVVVPIPLRAEGAGDCSASAELQSETGLLFIIKLQGFLPGESVQTQSQYKKEVLSAKKAASPSGELAIPILFGPGDHGTASFTATTDRCVVRLEYKIGEDAVVH